MKVFAIATAKPSFTPDKIQQYMPAEVRATVQHYLDGTIEQFWFRELGSHAGQFESVHGVK